MLCRVPSDAMGVILRYLEADGIARLGTCCRELQAQCSDEEVWKRVCGEELGLPAPRSDRDSWKEAFRQVALGNAVWEGYVVVKQEEHVPAFAESHPVVDLHYGVEACFQVPPIPVRLRTKCVKGTGKRGGRRIIGKLQYLARKLDVNDMTPLQFAYRAFCSSSKQADGRQKAGSSASSAAYCDDGNDGSDTEVLDERIVAGEIVRDAQSGASKIAWTELDCPAVGFDFDEATTDNYLPYLSCDGSGFYPSEDPGTAQRGSESTPSSGSSAFLRHDSSVPSSSTATPHNPPSSTAFITSPRSLSPFPTSPVSFQPADPLCSRRQVSVNPLTQPDDTHPSSAPAEAAPIHAKTEYAGTLFGRRGIVGTHTAGCFYLILADSRREYAALQPGSTFAGYCVQRDYTEEVYEMKMSLDGVSHNSGVTHGRLEYPRLRSISRTAGIYGVLREEVSDRIFSPRANAVGAPPPPLCTLFASPPLRARYVSKATRFVFCEYQCIQRGNSVVPTFYTCEVSGPFVFGVYHDNIVLNHGTFALRRQPHQRQFKPTPAHH
ncbi:hypothetical protein DIPPA_32191 [Diplonema papillatum]|nr:hypothetical protein DIPPA_32191 [Diplonema papillatum]|eukprot:gene3598-5583_t